MHYNDFVRWILRSPLHGLLSNGNVLITLVGRKSGRIISLPVSYYAADEHTLWVISTRGRTWWRNLQGGAVVTLRLRGRDVSARAEAILVQEQVSDQLKDYLARFPSLARYLHITIKDGIPDAEGVAREAATRLFVKLTLLPDSRAL